MMNPTPKLVPAHRRTAFTLIEILVVISIITVLVGISIPVAIKMLASGESSAQLSLLNGLASAADSYNIETQQVVDHKIDEDEFGTDVELNVGDLDLSDGDDDRTLAWFVVNAGQVPEAAKLIAISAKKDLTFDGRPMLNVQEDLATFTAAISGDIDAELDLIQLLDNWDNKIRYAGGVTHGRELDGLGNSINFTDDDYLPAHPTAFFASAGPDGLWGAVIIDTNEPDPSVDDDGDGVADAADNIYSFDFN